MIGSSKDFSGRRVLRVDIQHMERPVATDCDGGTKLMSSRFLEATLEEGGGADVEIQPLARAFRAVSLQFFLHIGLSASLRSSLFGQFLKMPLHSDMCPLHLAVDQGVLHFDSLDTTNQAQNAHVMNKTAALLNLFHSELQLPFSFLEYGSGTGNLSLGVAALFPNSSVISVEPDETKATAHYRRLKNYNISNNVITVHAADNSIADKLFQSPEFLRYQVR